MSFIEAVKTTVGRFGSRLARLEERVGRSVRDDSAIDAGSGGTPPGILPYHYASQEDLAFVVITSVVQADGSFNAKRYTPTIVGAGTLAQDDEQTDNLKVFPIGGATPFHSSSGFVRYCGQIGTPPGTALWLTMHGNWNGFRARLTDAPDTNEAYAWTQVGHVAAITTPLTNTIGTPQLGRAWDYSYFSKEPTSSIPQSDRNSYPLSATGPIVTLHWDPVNSRMFFYARREIMTDPTCV